MHGLRARQKAPRLRLWMQLLPGLTAHVVCLAQEIDTLCAEWQPEPLVPALTAAQRAAKPPVLVG